MYRPSTSNYWVYMVYKLNFKMPRTPVWIFRAPIPWRYFIDPTDPTNYLRSHIMTIPTLLGVPTPGLGTPALHEGLSH